MNVREVLERRGAEIVGEESEGGQTRLSVVQTCLNELYELREEFEAVRYVGVRGDHFVVDVCERDHDTRENATWYGGDPNHEFFHCDECGARISIPL